MRTFFTRTASVAVVIACTLTASSSGAEREQAMGPLVKHPVNPRYFADPAGNAIFLTGSHTWACFQERGVANETPDFDYDRYLNFLTRHGHNFIRLWVWEQAQWMQFKPKAVPVRYTPLPFQRTGPGLALDGQLRFDLTRFNEAYFTRLRNRVIAAQKQGIYVSVMLFQGFSLDKTRGDRSKGNAWHGHPFNAANNVNHIDGNPSHDDTGREVHTLAIPKVTKIQERYVRKVIDTVGDLDNVLWEIGNECDARSVQWQYRMIRFIRKCETDRPMQHPIGMTGAPISTDALRKSPADWISPKGKQWLNKPIANRGDKIVIVDSDHCDPWNHEPDWVWKNLLSGNHFILMDGYMDYRLDSPPKPNPQWTNMRQAMGRARAISQQIDLRHFTPAPNLASTGYCLANSGKKYLVYRPTGSKRDVTIQCQAGKYDVTWIDAATGKPVSHSSVTLTRKQQTLPSPAPGALLVVLERRRSPATSKAPASLPRR